MSGNKEKKVVKTSSCQIQVTSTPQGKGSEPPAKSKRTFSEVSETSVEEMSFINQQLDHLSSDLKDTKTKVMSLMSAEEVQNFITQTVAKVMEKVEKKVEKVIEQKIKEKTQELADRLESLDFEKNELADRLKQAELDLRRHKEKVKDLETIAIASAQRSNYNEQYSRKNNIKILNIPENATETERTLTEVICSTLLSKGNVDLDPQDIIAMHRIPGKQGSPKPVLLKLKNTSVKTAVMKQRRTMKAAGFKLVDDVTKLNSGLIGRLLQHNRIESAWYFNGAVYGKTIEGQRHKFDIYCNIDSEIGRTAGQRYGRDEQLLRLGSMEP